MQITDYHAKYYAHELTKRCSSDSLEKLTTSLLDAQVDLNPHQVDAALFAFKSPFSTGAILADEVGLGKTIEAGIVLAQKWAEHKRTILVIVPSSLRNQWSQELADKFFIPSEILEAKNFNRDIKNGRANPFARDTVVICSYHFARNKADLVSQVRWDLVVIDEAHRLRNVYKAGNKIARAIRDSLEHAPKLLLTATPLQNSLMELYGLVCFVDEYTFGDQKSFRSQFARLISQDTYDELKSRLSLICKRTLRRQVAEYIKYTNRIPVTQEFVPSKDEEELYELVSDYLRRPSLQALPASQRSLMTLVLRKLLASSTFAIAGALTSLINKLEARLRDLPRESDLPARSAQAGEDELHQDYELLNEQEDEWSDNGEEPADDLSACPPARNAPAGDAQAGHRLSKEDVEAIEQEIADLTEFRNLAESIVHNAKGQVLTTALDVGFAKAEALGAQRKAVIFTESRRTQTYLFNLLSDAGFNLPAPRPDVFLVYVIECADGSHYIGQTGDLRTRWSQHRAGTAAKWTKNHKPRKIVHYEELPSREEAVEREKWLKTGFGRKWLKREINAGRARQAGGKLVMFNGSNNDPDSRVIYHNWLDRHQGTDRISGSRTSDQRAAIVDYFRNEAEIMIATEAAAEGINLQFCSLVVNYDLPWNPQRIEQRIGRCHRYGQQHDVVVVNFLNKHNAADQRVFELLSEKFALFSGVFGASDEVLGSIESGVDFEKRILGIYQTCRTPEEIQLSFDQLQAELGGKIDEKMQVTRQRLLENFDEEVHEKLKVNLHESTDYLNRYERMLWNLTCHALDPYADFAPDDPACAGDTRAGKHVFTLQACPEGASVPVGKYRMGKNVDDAHHYRFNHPLAQHLMCTCAEAALSTSEVTFAYSESPAKVSILEPLNGQEGWLRVMVLRIESLEAEDHVLMAGATDLPARGAQAGSRQDLTPEQCQRLFNIPAQVGGTCYPPKEMERVLDGTLLQLEKGILQANAERNAGFFDTEMSKLERWAQDVKTSLEIRLKQLDVEIKTRKAEARKMVNLQEKVKAHREIKDLEKQRSEMRLSLYQAQDDVDAKKEGLLEEIEARLSQSLSREVLFTIRWRLA